MAKCIERSGLSRAPAPLAPDLVVPKRVVGG